MKAEEYEAYQKALKDRQRIAKKVTDEKSGEISEIFEVKLATKPERGRNRFILTSGGSLSSTAQA